MRQIPYGLPKVLFASVASGITKLFGKQGVFYKIVGQEVSGLDGFYDHVWEEYKDIVELFATTRTKGDALKEVRELSAT